MKEEELKQELKSIKEGLLQLNDNLKSFIDTHKTEFATLINGEKQVQLSSSKLSATELLTVCKHALDIMDGKYD